MKKIFSIFVMLLIVTVCCFAQKANVKKAYSKSEALFEDNPDYTAALDLIEPALQDETTKNDPYTWWVAAHIYDRMIGYEMYKQTMGQSSDNELMQEAAYKAYDYYLKAVELEKIPNAKGKVSDKYTKKAVDMLIWFYNNGLIANYGETQRKYENYEDAIKAYEKHLAIPDLQFIKDSKFCSPKEGDNCPKKNNEIYWNVKFIVAICTQLSGDNDNAITKYEAIKDKGYEENKIYQQLYYLYREKNDTSNYLRTLDEGIVRFPDEFYYLGMKINYLIDNGHVQQAIDYLQQAIERDPTKAQYYNVMGNLYSNIGKRIEAMRNYDKAIELEPQNADFLVSKASSIYSEAKEMETAALTTRDPKTAEMLNVTARAKFKEAVNYFHKALELDENNSEALQSLKGYYFKINDMKKYNEFDAKIKAL